MNGRLYASLVACFFLSLAAVAAPGGKAPGANGIDHVVVAPDNYRYFLPRQAPDSAVAYLVRSIVRDTAQRTIAGNRACLQMQLGKDNIRFFRCFFRSGGIIDRYIDLTAAGKLQAEALASSGRDGLIEKRRFFPDGALKRSSSYHHVEVPEGRAPVPWYSFDAQLVKEGVERAYYRSGRARLAVVFHDGVLADSSYTEWTEDGVAKRTIDVKGGRIQLTDLSTAVSEVHRRRAFLFGIDFFQPPAGVAGAPGPLPFPNIEGAGNDVHLLRDVLVNQRGLPAENVTSIIGRAATRSEVLRAFQSFKKGVKVGDYLFLHFSGQGMLREKGAGMELMLPTTDIWRFSAETSQRTDSGLISQKELQGFLHDLQERVGLKGQVVLSIDVCHAGALLADTTDVRATSADAGRVYARGESPNLLLNFIERPAAPSAILTSTTIDAFGYETSSDDGRVYGLYSYILAQQLANPMLDDMQDLAQAVAEAVAALMPQQRTGYLVNKSFRLFEELPVADGAPLLSLPKLKANGSAFLLSIGNSQYGASMKSASFANASADAAAYSAYFSNSFLRLAADDTTSKLSVRLLRDSAATKAAILSALNEAISRTKPEDYFVLNFSGYCRTLKDSSGKPQTWFLPYGISHPNDENDIRANGISLKQLKDLLQLVPANNQLFITEAGSTADFQKEFIQALIESSPTVAALSNKNRIFLVPKSSGLDRFRCAGIDVEHGPLNYYVTSLPAELNIFGIFTDSIYREAIRYALTKAEVACDYFRSGYFDFFSEREFVKGLTYFMPEEAMHSRGIGVQAAERKAYEKGIGRRYALVVGTDRYAGKPDWRDLDNPVFDAREIAVSLRRNFGFDTVLLIDQPSDSLYARILWLAGKLQPSDQLLVYVGGHGDFDDRLFDDGFIVSANSRALRDDPYRNSYVQYSKLSRMINKLPANQILMVLDVCFGGTFDERVVRNKSRSREYDDLQQSAYISEKLKKRTRIYLTSGGKREVPDGYKGKHSPFAVRLLEALQTKGGSGKVLTATDLFQFVQKLPSGPLLGSFGDDEPGSEFVLVGQ